MLNAQRSISILHEALSIQHETLAKRKFINISNS